MLPCRAAYCFCLLFFLAVVFSGCETQNRTKPDAVLQSPAIQIAICDIDEIAEELGLLDELNRMLSKHRTLLSNQIRKLQAQRQLAFSQQIEEYGEFPDEEQKRQLARMQAEANQTIRQMQNRANQVFASMRASLVEQIRTKIKKPVDKVATDKGINIVVSEHQDLVLYTASAANITPEVLSAARSMNLGGLELESPTGPNNAPDTTNSSQTLRSESGRAERESLAPLEPPADRPLEFNE